MRIERKEAVTAWTHREHFNIVCDLIGYQMDGWMMGSER